MNPVLVQPKYFSKVPDHKDVARYKHVRRASSAGSGELLLDQLMVRAGRVPESGERLSEDR
jgi:hypothetical protein